MPDIKDTIRRLEKIAGHAVHYVGEPPFIMSLDDGNAIHEAIDLMKKQIPIEPRIQTSYDGKGTWWYICGSCNKAVNPKDKYCRECGQKVKWE